MTPVEQRFDRGVDCRPGVDDVHQRVVPARLGETFARPCVSDDRERASWVGAQVGAGLLDRRHDGRGRKRGLAPTTFLDLGQKAPTVGPATIDVLPAFVYDLMDDRVLRPA